MSELALAQRLREFRETMLIAGFLESGVESGDIILISWTSTHVLGVSS